MCYSPRLLRGDRSAATPLSTQQLWEFANYLMLLEQVGRRHSAQRKTAWVPRSLLLYIRNTHRHHLVMFSNSVLLANSLTDDHHYSNAARQLLLMKEEPARKGSEQPAELLTLTRKRRKVTRTHVFSSLRCLNHRVQDLQRKKKKKKRNANDQRS